MDRAILILSAVIALETTAMCVGFIEANQRIARVEARVLGGCAPPGEKSIWRYCRALDSASRRGIGVYTPDSATSLDDLSSKVDDLTNKVDDIAAKLNV